MAECKVNINRTVRVPLQILPSQSARLIKEFQMLMKSDSPTVDCHHSMARPQVVDLADDINIWRLAARVSTRRQRMAG